MTAAHPHVSARASALAPAAQARPVSWAAVGVMAAIAMHLAAGVWFAATLSARVHAVEQELPPAGAIQRLDERTVEMQRTLERLEARP